VPFWCDCRCHVNGFLMPVQKHTNLSSDLTSCTSNCTAVPDSDCFCSAHREISVGGCMNLRAVLRSGHT
jgi:hypothetical protein